MQSIKPARHLFRGSLQPLPRAIAVGRAPYLAQRQIRSISMGTKTDITLYTAATPNGIKIPILLEELGLEYKVCFPYTLLQNTGRPWSKI